MLRWDNEWAIYLLAAVPLLLLAFVVYKVGRKRSLQKFADHHLVKRLGIGLPLHKLEVKFVFVILAVCSLIVAIANPKIGSKMEEVKREGIDIMVALDVSRSMNATDVEPDRLSQAKLFLNKLIQNLAGDRIGLIIFAGNAYVQMPITTDHSAALLFLESISSEIVPTQGTAIGEALRLGVESFGEESKTNKAIIVISDGENHEGDAVKASREANAMGVLTYAVGVGTDRGSPVPLKRKGVQYDFQRDKEGNIITSKMNPEMLKEVAEAGGGSYLALTNTRETSEMMIEELSKLEKQEMEARVFTDYEDHFQIFIGICLILLIVEWIVSYKRNRFLKKLDLFED